MVPFFLRVLFVCMAATLFNYSTKTPYSMNSFNTKISPFEISDVCPGAEHLKNRGNKTASVLKVNVSDCRRNLPRFTANQGVVYVTCDDSNTVCILRLEVQRGRFARARLQRLQYWCGIKTWKTVIRNFRMKCDFHSPEEYFYISRKYYLPILHLNNPQVKLNVTGIKRLGVVQQYTGVHSGYVAVPFMDSPLSDFDAELQGTPQFIIAFSVQQSELAPCFNERITVQLTYKEMDKSIQKSIRVCLKSYIPASTYFASYLKIRIPGCCGYDYFKIAFFFIHENNQLQKLPRGLFNCSVSHYPKFQDVIGCNIKRECEDGQDETEHCPFSSPGCQGLVASRNKCYYLLTLNMKNDAYSILQFECQKMGGRVASVKSRLEQKHFLHILQSYYEFYLVIGYVSGWYSVPFLYSQFTKWSKTTLIYHMDHFKVSSRYAPSRKLKIMYLKTMFVYYKPWIHMGYNQALCEINSHSLTYLPLPVLITPLRSKSILINTQQFLFVCFNHHVVHIFFKCDPSGGHEKASTQFSKPLNVSDDQIINISAGMIARASAMFRCGDDVTTLHYTFVCNFRQDCPDSSDESFCNHPSSEESMCSNGQRLLHSQRCNQFSDCLDNTDECKCPALHSHHPTVTGKNRTQRFYIILDGTGYFTQRLMNAEQTCPDTHYRCPSEWLYCLPVYTRCNGFSDCVYGEDEEHCKTVTCSGFYQCRDSTVCVHGDHLCDGWAQCPQRDDEIMCDNACPEMCLCQGHSFLCNECFHAKLFPQLRYVNARGSKMFLTDFTSNLYLIHLILSYCSMTNVSQLKLSNLQVMDLGNNQLETLDMTPFFGLPNLRILLLANNPIKQVTSSLSKQVHYALKLVDISQTSCNVLQNMLSVFLPHVEHLNASFSVISAIRSVGFKNVPQLSELDIKGNPLNHFPLNLLLGLSGLKRILSSNYRFCCDQLLPSESHRIRCTVPKVILPSCVKLLPTQLGVAFFCLVGVSLILGSLGCFIVSVAIQNVFGKGFKTFVAHLLFSNICMGIHISISLVAYGRFYDRYIYVERSWTSSLICQVGGFLYFLSCQVSVMITCLISLNHVKMFCFPSFSGAVNLDSACILIWCIDILMSVIPLLPGLEHWGREGQSGLCRLALFQNHSSEGQFRWFTVIVVEDASLCSVTIPCQIAIFRRSVKNRPALDPTERSLYAETRLMRRLSVVYTTCWLSFSLVAVVASGGVSGLDIVYGAMLVFLLPLSSALSPLLYLWTITTQRRRQVKEDNLVKMFKSRLAVIGKK